MRVAIIGPAAPYRGGIAHHNTMLASELIRQGHDVDVITFSRQYPEFLYPGAFQEEGGESDLPSERMLDSMNPVNWVTTGRKLRNRAYDLHLTRFWIPLFGPMFGTLQRLIGRNIVTVVDNLYPHEKRFGDSAFTSYQFGRCDGAITQSGTVSRQFRERFPEIPERMLPHPTYEQFGEGIDRSDARARLGVQGEPLLLFFGFVRHYKGLDLLIDAMPEILDRRPGAKLMIVGEFFGGSAETEQLIERKGLKEKVILHDAYVPSEDVCLWFSAADLLVLPYRNATNSGIVQIAYNFALPSEVTDVGSLSEVVIDGKTGIVIPDGSTNSIATGVERATSASTLETFRAGILEERRKYTWSAFATGLIDFVQTERLAAP